MNAGVIKQDNFLVAGPINSKDKTKLQLPRQRMDCLDESIDLTIRSEFRFLLLA